MATETRWRAVFADLLTDRTIDTLPLTGVRLEVAISQGGTLSGAIPVPDEAMGARVAPIVEGRTAVYAVRTLGDLTEIWFGGIVWTRVDRGERDGSCTVQIQAGTFDTYLGRRDITSTLRYVQTDQLAILRDLWTHAQAEPSGNIGVLVGDETCGVLRDHTWLGTDAARYADAVEQVTAQDDGPEWLVDAYLDEHGHRTKRLRLGHPHIGDPDVVTTVTRPGPLLEYDVTGDASAAGTRFRARGATPEAAGTDVPPLFSDTYTADDWLAAGWPLLDVTEDHPDVPLVGTLQALAAKARNTRPGTVRLAQATADPSVGISPARLGTSVRAVVIDPLHPRRADGSPSLDMTRRVIGLTVSPAERGRPEEVGLVYEETDDA